MMSDVDDNMRQMGGDHHHHHVGDDMQGEARPASIGNNAFSDHHTPMPDMNQQREDMSNMHMDMMKMYFHGGCQETILFSFWRTSTVAGMVLSALLVLVMAVAYEGVKFCKDELYSKKLLRGREGYDAVSDGGQSSAAASATGSSSSSANSHGHHGPEEEALGDEQEQVIVRHRTSRPRRGRAGPVVLRGHAPAVLSREHLVLSLLNALQVLTQCWSLLLT